MDFFFGGGGGIFLRIEWRLVKREGEGGRDLLELNLFSLPFSPGNIFPLLPHPSFSKVDHSAVFPRGGGEKKNKVLCSRQKCISHFEKEGKKFSDKFFSTSISIFRFFFFVASNQLSFPDTNY